MTLKRTLFRLAESGAAVAIATALLATAGPGSATAATAAQESASAATAAAVFYVKNANTGLCLTANQLAQPRNSVFTNTCVNAASQKWHIAGGRFTSQGNDRCLTADDIGILTYPCIDNFVPQQWTVDSTTKKWISNDYYGLCMHSSGAALEYVSMRICGSDASRWTFVAA